MINEENKTLYSAKFIAAILVIFIHCMFPGNVGIIIKNIARFAVPLFFIISGYYWKSSHKNDGDNKKNKRRINRALRLLLYSVLLYGIVNVTLSFFSGSIHSFITSISDIHNWIYLIVFNYTTPFLGVGHLWYLLALLYVYFLIVIVEKRNLWRLANILSVIILIMTFVIEYTSFFTSSNIPGFYYRNWLCIGFPMFVLGRFISEHKDFFSKIDLRICSIIYIILFVIETLLFNDSLEILVNSLVACLIIMCLSIKNPNIDLYSICGKKYSQWIYIYHYLFVIGASIISSRLNNTMVNWINPIVVLTATFLFCLLTDKMNKKIIASN